MLASNLQTYQHSRWSLEWIRNSSCRVFCAAAPGTHMRDEEHITMQHVASTQDVLYCHWLCIFVGWMRAREGSRKVHCIDGLVLQLSIMQMWWSHGCVLLWLPASLTHVLLLFDTTHYACCHDLGDFFPCRVTPFCVNDRWRGKLFHLQSVTPIKGKGTFAYIVCLCGLYSQMGIYWMGTLLRRGFVFLFSRRVNAGFGCRRCCVM